MFERIFDGKAEGSYKIIYDQIICAGFLFSELNFSPIDIRKEINEALCVYN